jgi:hypothetical protein
MLAHARQEHTTPTRQQHTNTRHTPHTARQGVEVLRIGSALFGLVSWPLLLLLGLVFSPVVLVVLLVCLASRFWRDSCLVKPTA